MNIGLFTSVTTGATAGAASPGESESSVRALEVDGAEKLDQPRRILLFERGLIDVGERDRDLGARDVRADKACMEINP